MLKQAPTAAFAPQVAGLRGTPHELATFAKRYRVSYSVTSASPGHPYDVTHSAAVYVFHRTGNIKLLFTDLSATTPLHCRDDAATSGKWGPGAGGSWPQQILNVL